MASLSQFGVGVVLDYGMGNAESYSTVALLPEPKTKQSTFIMLKYQDTQF